MNHEDMNHKDMNHKDHKDHKDQEDQKGHKGNHQDHKEHKGNASHNPGKVASPLAPNVERAVREVIGSALAVHRALGPGFTEPVYDRALAIELRCRGLVFVQHAGIDIVYRGEIAYRHRLDLVVENAVVVEVKAVKKLKPLHHAQVLSYLKAGNYRVGLLINFNSKLLVDGIKRFVR